MNFDRKSYSEEKLVELYEGMLVPRLIEERMLLLLRQGKITKWFSGIGQEAISTGVVNALEEDEYILPLHRNLGIFTGRGIPLSKLYAQFQGKRSGFTKGRDRSFHFGSNKYHLVGMISHLGPQLSVADGIALASKLSKENKATVVFSGEGGTSEGEFHEALNVAAVWDLPVIFIVENNGYALSTPVEEQFRSIDFKTKGPAYGMEAKKIDGNNILEVYDTVNEVAADIRNNPRPVLIEAQTFRMRGHEEASGTKYVPSHLFEEWAVKDPLENFEEYLIDSNILSKEECASRRDRFKEQIKRDVEKVAAGPIDNPDPSEELSDIYAPYAGQTTKPAGPVTNKRYVDAISDSLKYNLEKNEKLVIMGQDIAEYGGVFKVTEGFAEKFGKERVRNTPLCESAIIGTALGLSIKGYKAIVEMQFADFVSCGFNQIVNNLAKIHYRWGQNADVVIRMPTGAGVGAGPFHSQSTESWFFHIAGLKIFYPSTPYDAKGLLNTAIEDPNPVLFFEHKYLYRSETGAVPDEYYTIKEEEAAVVTEGEDLSIITYGRGVLWAKETMAKEKDYSADIIDLRCLLPWDKEKVAESVKKTGKVLVLTEDTLTGSITAEIAAWITEYCFEYLDAPVMREGSLDTPVPFAKTLENNFLPEVRLTKKVKQLLEF